MPHSFLSPLDFPMPCSSRGLSRKYAQEIVELKVAQITKNEMLPGQTSCNSAKSAVIPAYSKEHFDCPYRKFFFLQVIEIQARHTDGTFTATVDLATSWHARCQPKAICPEFLRSWNRFITEAADTFLTSWLRERLQAAFSPASSASAFDLFVYLH